MTRAVRFTKAEIANAALVSQEMQVIVKLTRDGDLVVFPALHTIPRVDTTPDEDLDAQLVAFEAEHGGD